MTKKAAWRMVFESYPCPTCGAHRGEPCITSGGREAEIPHAERTRDADRCPRCGTLVADRLDPGAMCGRCALIRALEVERSTIYHRRDP